MLNEKLIRRIKEATTSQRAVTRVMLNRKLDAALKGNDMQTAWKSASLLMAHRMVSDTDTLLGENGEFQKRVQNKFKKPKKFMYDSRIDDSFISPFVTYELPNCLGKLKLDSLYHYGDWKLVMGKKQLEKVKAAKATVSINRLDKKEGLKHVAEYLMYLSEEHTKIPPDYELEQDYTSLIEAGELVLYRFDLENTICSKLMNLGYLCVYTQEVGTVDFVVLFSPMKLEYSFIEPKQAYGAVFNILSVYGKEMRKAGLRVRCNVLCQVEKLQAQFDKMYQENISKLENGTILTPEDIMENDDRGHSKNKQKNIKQSGSVAKSKSRSKKVLPRRKSVVICSTKVIGDEIVMIG